MIGSVLEGKYRIARVIGEGETLQLTTNVLAGLAGAAAVAAVVLVFLTDFGGEEPEDDGSGATVGSWPGGLVVTW